MEKRKNYYYEQNYTKKILLLKTKQKSETKKEKYEVGRGVFPGPLFCVLLKRPHSLTNQFNYSSLALKELGFY